MAFPTFNLSPAAFVALVPLLAGLFPAGGRCGAGRAFRLGFVHGLAFYLVLLHWIPRLPPENVTVPFLMYPALGLMALYLSLYPAVWAWGVARLSGGRQGILILIAPAAWVLLEWLRAFGITGFPWGSLGYSQWAGLEWIQFAAIGGLWSVSFWIVAVNVALFEALRNAGRIRLGWIAAVLFMLLAPWLHGRGELDRLASASPAQPVLLIQQNTGNDKWDPARRAEVIHNLVSMTLDEAGALPPEALIIWPETATPTLLRRDEANYGYVKSACAAAGRAILTGFPDYRMEAGPDSFRTVQYFNAAGLLLPGRGIVEKYAKIRLVPFSEWMPIPGLNRVNFGQSNFTPGDSLHVFSRFAPPFSVLICFESIFPDLARNMVRKGARFLINVTNDQWFGRSPAPYQHLTMGVFRAVENRVGIARAANTGVTCLIEPTGRIMNATDLFVPAAVRGSVRLAGSPTFYNRHGDWILWLSAVLVLLPALPPLRRR